MTIALNIIRKDIERGALVIWQLLMVLLDIRRECEMM